MTKETCQSHFSKQRKQKLFACNQSIDFLWDSCGYLFQKYYNISKYPFESRRNARRIHMFWKFSCRSSESEGKDGIREKRIRRGGAYKKWGKERRRRRILDTLTCVLEASGRVAFDVHRMMSAPLEEEEQRKRKKKKRDFLRTRWKLPLRRRTASTWGSRDRRKSPVRRSQLNPSAARGRPSSMCATISPKGTQT